MIMGLRYVSFTLGHAGFVVSALCTRRYVAKQNSAWLDPAGSKNAMVTLRHTETIYIIV